MEASSALARSNALYTAGRGRNSRSSGKRRSRLLLISTLVGGMLLLVGAAAVWLGVKASTVSNELQAATRLIAPLKVAIAADDAGRAAATAEEISNHTSAAKGLVDDPLWTLASAVPGLGPNLTAIAEVSRSADDVAQLALTPLVTVFQSLDWNNLLPSEEGADLEALKSASPTVSSAAHAVRASEERLTNIKSDQLLPQVAEPLLSAQKQLQEVTGALDAAADASSLAPGMLGVETPQSYLLMVQNNAEARASGGIPGALAVLTLDNGRLTLGSQSSATALGAMSPTLPLDDEQKQIYSARLGKFMQDVNLTPDFPTSAKLAQEMWEKKTGQRVDGVLSVDPIALGYILEATGPITIADSELSGIVATSGLPLELTGANVVRTLLSDVYANIERPDLQDAYFAGVAQEIFGALSSGTSDAKELISGITRATQEGRLLVWSGASNKQSVISSYALSGSIAGPSVLPAQFGVYFNDGTGAKMDYYVRRTVQLIRDCPKDGYQQTTVRVTSTNTAPDDAATSLPSYVTGAGVFGVPPGHVQTNVTAYGPTQADVEFAKVNGRRTEFAPNLHSGRPVGVLAVRLAPGETVTIDFTFGKIVQHTEPNVVVTPTVQPVKEVTLPTENASCS